MHGHTCVTHVWPHCNYKASLVLHAGYWCRAHYSICHVGTQALAMTKHVDIVLQAKAITRWIYYGPDSKMVGCYEIPVQLQDPSQE